MFCPAAFELSINLHAVCRKLTLDKVGVTNGVVRGLSDLHSLEELLLPNSQRVTDAGLAFFSQLTNLRLVTMVQSCSSGEVIVHSPSDGES